MLRECKCNWILRRDIIASKKHSHALERTTNTILKENKQLCVAPKCDFAASFALHVLNGNPRGCLPSGPDHTLSSLLVAIPFNDRRAAGFPSDRRSL